MFTFTCYYLKYKTLPFSKQPLFWLTLLLSEKKFALVSALIFIIFVAPVPCSSCEFVARTVQI